MFEEQEGRSYNIVYVNLIPAKSLVKNFEGAMSCIFSMVSDEVSHPDGMRYFFQVAKDY